MCLYTYNYRGFIIYKNINDDFKSVYYSVYNPSNYKHVHISNNKGAKAIVDCYKSKYKNRFGRIIRNKALRLAGYNVYY